VEYNNIIDILFFTVALRCVCNVHHTCWWWGSYSATAQPSKKNSDALLSMSPTVLSRRSRTSDYQPRFGIAKLPSPIVSARGGPVPLLCKTAAAARCRFSSSADAVSSSRPSPHADRVNQGHSLRQPEVRWQLWGDHGGLCGEYLTPARTSSDKQWHHINQHQPVSHLAL
jgi:hypothetical protein